MPIFAGWQTKPPLGTPINWYHPLSQSLGLTLLFNEGGRNPIDLVSGFPIPLSGTCNWGSSPYGGSLSSDGSTGTGSANFPLLNGTNYPSVSIAIVVNSPIGDHSFGTIVEKGVTTEWGFSTNQVTANTICLYQNGFILETATAVCDGTWHVIHATSAYGSQCLYVDGALSSTSNNASMQTFFDDLYLFKYATVGYQSLSMLSGLWVWQNRILTPSDVASHASNPWQIYAEPGYYWLLKATAAAQNPVFPTSMSMSVP